IHCVGDEVGHHEVQDAVGVEVPHGNGPKASGKYVCSRGPKGTVAVAEQYIYLRALGIDDEKVGNTVAVEVVHGYDKGTGGVGEPWAGTERSVAVAQE